MCCLTTPGLIKGHLASNMTVTLASGYLLRLLLLYTYYHHFCDHVLTYISIILTKRYATVNISQIVEMRQ